MVLIRQLTQLSKTACMGGLSNGHEEFKDTYWCNVIMFKLCDFIVFMSDNLSFWFFRVYICHLIVPVCGAQLQYCFEWLANLYFDWLFLVSLYVEILFVPFPIILKVCCCFPGKAQILIEDRVMAVSFRQWLHNWHFSTILINIYGCLAHLV